MYSINIYRSGEHWEDRQKNTNIGSPGHGIMGDVIFKCLSPFYLQWRCIAFVIRKTCTLTFFFQGHRYDWAYNPLVSAECTIEQELAPAGWVPSSERPCDGPLTREGVGRHWPGSLVGGPPHHRAPRWSWQTCWRWWAPWARARSVLCSGPHNSCPHTPPYLAVWLEPGRLPPTVAGLATGQPRLCRDHNRWEGLAGNRSATPAGWADPAAAIGFAFWNIVPSSINHQSQYENQAELLSFDIRAGLLFFESWFPLPLR